MSLPRYILPIIVFSQFCCTSLWFAGNSILEDLTTAFGFSDAALGPLTSSVQFGFIIGTLVFAFLTIADRFSPSRVFFVCAFLGAAFNLCIIWDENSLISIIGFRLITGFFLAGIYPVGMKIAADYYDKGLGKSLGYLVGALVLGTAFPHLLKGLSLEIPWKGVLVVTSALAFIGGLLMLLLVPNGPFRKESSKLQLSAFTQVFKNVKFRRAAFGYFGHMWELYAFWAFVPFILTTFNKMNSTTQFNVSLWSFIIIGIGTLGCIVAGYLSIKLGSKKVAFSALLISGICCISSPFFFETSPYLFIALLLIWGFTVIADSPLFSTLVAQSATPSLKGTALTITNCIGFAITIGSIQLLNGLIQDYNPKYIYTVLVIGPLLGLFSLNRKS